MKPHLITIIIIIVFLGVIVNLSRSIFSLRSKQGKLQAREQALMETKQANLNLKRKLVEVQTEEYIEKQARERLNMALEGESVVFLPKELVEQYANNSNISKEYFADPSHWRTWWNLFF